MSSSFDHIANHVKEFTESPDEGFSVILSNLEAGHAAEYKRLFIYLDKVINHALGQQGEECNFFHIHFTGEYEKLWEPVLEFLCVKFFFRHFLTLDPTGGGKTFLTSQIANLDRTIGSPISIPLGAKGGSQKANKAALKRKEIKGLKAFYDCLLTMFDSGPALEPKVLINLLKRERDIFLEDRFKVLRFALAVEDVRLPNIGVKETSLVALNSDLDRDTLEDKIFPNDFNIIDNLKDVIIFDCEARNVHDQFTYHKIVRLNEEGSTLKNVALITFDKNEFRLSSLISHLDRALTKYYFKAQVKSASYVILPEELRALNITTDSKDIGIEFIGGYTLLCQQFQELINDFEELYELYSIKMRNIYALCMSDSYKDIVLDDLFGGHSKPQLVSQDVKNRLAILPAELQAQIKAILGQILTLIKSYGLREKISEVCKAERYNFVVSQKVLDHVRLFQQLKKDLGNDLRPTFYTWSTLPPQPTVSLLFLDYRDPGMGNIYPNLFETKLSTRIKGRGIFLSMLFKFNYERNRFRFNKLLFEKIASHPIRTANFNWPVLIKEIKHNAPGHDFDHLWDLGNNYSDSGERETIVVTFGKASKRTFAPSQLCLLKAKDSKHLTTIRAEGLSNIYVGQSVQMLDSLYEGLNLFEATEQEENELAELRAQYKLSKETIVWKALLKREVENRSVDVVYKELENYSRLVNEPMVSKIHFQGSWLDLTGDTFMPRSKKLFKVVCDLLNLSNVYFRVMLKRRAREKLASRNSNSKMNLLISDMINLGMFDDDQVYSAESFDQIKGRHDMDEVGITDENIVQELKTLIELLKTNLDLKEIKNVEHRQL